MKKALILFFALVTLSSKEVYSSWFHNTKNAVELSSTEVFSNIKIKENKVYHCLRYHENGEYLEGLWFVGVKIMDSAEAFPMIDHYGKKQRLNKDCYAKFIGTTTEINVLHFGLRTSKNYEPATHNRFAASNRIRMTEVVNYFMAYGKNSPKQGSRYTVPAGRRNKGKDPLRVAGHLNQLTIKRSVYFPPGIFTFDQNINFAVQGMQLKGAGRRSTIIKYVGTEENAIAFKVNGPNELLYDMSFSDFTVVGNEYVKYLFFVQNCEHIRVENVAVREAGHPESVGFQIYFSVCGYFENLVCSTDEVSMQYPIYEGINLGPSLSRKTHDHSTANTFINPIIEGCTYIGVRLQGADLNVFTGGTSESIGAKGRGYGVIFGPNSKMNTWTGGVFENKYAEKDLSIFGSSNRVINSYSSKLAVIETDAIQFVLDGGFYHNIIINDNAKYTQVENLTFNHWNKSHPEVKAITNKGVNSAMNNLRKGGK